MAGGATGDRESWFLVLPLAETPRELRQAPGTLGIVLVSLAVVGLGDLWPEVTRALQSSTDAIADGELWRLVTYVFPHGGWVHVSFNMAVLSLFGWQLERRIGTAWLVAIYLGCGTVGMALLSAFNPIDAAHGLQRGASLAVFGTVAALAVWHGIASGRINPWAAGTCLVLLIAGGVTSISGHEGVIDEGVPGFTYGFGNHALGMIAGAVLVPVAIRTLRPTVRRSAAAVALLLTVGGTLVGLARWS